MSLLEISVMIFVFVASVMVFNCHILPPCQLNTSIHWYCYHNIHVYVVRFDDSVWYFCVEMNLFRFCFVLFVSICTSIGDPMIPLTDITPPHFCVHPSYPEQEILIITITLVFVGIALLWFCFSIKYFTRLACI